MTLHTLASLLVTLMIGQALPQTPAPKTTGATPSACLAEVRDYVAKRNAALAPIDTSRLTTDEIRALTQTQAWRDRIAVNSEISRHRSAMTAECLKKFDGQTVADAELVRLIELHSETGGGIEFS